MKIPSVESVMPKLYIVTVQIKKKRYQLYTNIHFELINMWTTLWHRDKTQTDITIEGFAQYLKSKDQNCIVLLEEQYSKFILKLQKFVGNELKRKH